MNTHQSLRKIGIFGGTFNPPHIGHISAALEFKRRLALDKVLFIPDYIPPHKNVEGATPQQRLEMTKLAVDNIPGFEVSDIEIKREGTSYAILTLKEFNNIYIDSEFYLLCGSDMFLTIEDWFLWEDILKLCTVVGASRNENEYGNLIAHSRHLRERYGAKTKIIRIKPVKVSSGEIRDKILKRENVSGLVSEPVLKYIIENCIYLKED